MTWQKIDYKNLNRSECLVFNDTRLEIGNKFIFDGYQFRVYPNYLEILIQDQALPKIPSPLCGLKSKESLAIVYEGRTDILGFSIEVKKNDEATFILIDNHGFRHSNDSPSYFGAIVQNSYESPKEYMTRHNISFNQEYWYEFLNIDNQIKLVNMDTKEQINMIDDPLNLGIRSGILNIFLDWIKDNQVQDSLWYEHCRKCILKYQINRS